ncbi:chromosome partition protein MukF [Aeromonas schubertii]|uniref:chromosome partition protein MukF n=1 Tax=Aeromonas schubertii TaxID=652 RepID=UPI0010A8A26D|nr:chromosome partition protein MukF [Aeromonas schubertii]QCG48084.1 chromosome partition protein MukF [Aeromonas schubertii]
MTSTTRLSAEPAYAGRSLPDTVGWVRQEGLALQLPTDRLAFLVAIKTLAEEESDLGEAALHDAFGYVSSAFGQMDETLSSRANNAINDLIRQQLLSRFTTDPVAGESLYRLSRLGVAIVDFFLESRQVDSIKLSILLEHLAAELDKARTAALETNTREQWEAEVLPRLTFSLEETMERIDLTQRAMDEQQSKVKEEIAALLTQDWMDAIHSCEKLLRETGQTLRELQDTLDAAGHRLQEGLLNIQEAAQGRDDLFHVEELTHALQGRLDVITSWGQQCIELWSRYDRHVHKFIRTAIDMDKNRAFSQRLRESIRQFEQHNWLLRIAEESRLLELRDETIAIHDEEVTGEVPAELEFQEVVDISAELAERIGRHLVRYKASGLPLDLAEVLREYLEEFPAHAHFDVTRLLVDQAVRLGHSSELTPHAQPGWKPVNQHGSKVQAYVIDQY